MPLPSIKPSSRFLSLSDRSAGETGEYSSDARGKAKAKEQTATLIKRLEELQERLYANGSRALLVVLQGMDTSGKDGTIRHVMSGVNPQGCKVVSFKEPTPDELRHDFLWRVHLHVPARGEIGIFNRSHYEDVLVTRVHGEISGTVARQRLTLINEFEQLLVDNGTAIIKFFLHISRKEQRKRLQERIDDPGKRWKFNEGDLDERRLWAEYLKAFEQMLPATSTRHSPWYVVPANHKWYRDLVVAERIVDALEAMRLKAPKGPAGINFDTLTIPD
jgi:PPK2 family polyphosphate:nucleotide phosphotransferase